jgi:hypothetical protein
LPKLPASAAPMLKANPAAANISALFMTSV